MALFFGEWTQYLIEVAFPPSTVPMENSFYFLFIFKVEHLRHLICAHYSLVRTWLLNVWDVYAAGSVVQAFIALEQGLGELSPDRRGQAALQAGRQESRGLKPGFPAFLSTEIPPTGRTKDSEAHCAGGRGIGLLVRTNAQRSPKMKWRRKWRKRKHEKTLQSSSGFWECSLFKFAFL